jgi:spermidine synthase
VTAPVLYIVFFASGASALAFEMLWFRQAGLALGNSIWASSLVLAAFMGGLGIGNAVAARYGERVRDPIRLYAIAEASIAITGVALVMLLPHLGALLAPALRPLLDEGVLINTARLAVAFSLLLIPSTAMGMTLPLVTRALAPHVDTFGPTLGRLYGLNTLGAVAGVLLTETWLIGAYGIRGTALIAGAINLAAAAAAFWLSMGSDPGDGSTQGVESSRIRGQTPESTRVRGLTPEARPWLLAAFATGFCLLALEVIWFRLLLLFIKGHATALALILALVLVGIAAGGLIAAAWLRRRPSAWRAAGPAAFVAGATCAIAYSVFPRVVGPDPDLIVTTGEIVRTAAPLILPVSIVSGTFFTLVGAALRRHLTTPTAAAGALTLANTAGAALGSLSGGLLLLPLLGVERSLALIAALYAVAGAALWPHASRGVAYASAALLAVAALFPFGSMQTRLLASSTSRWIGAEDEARIVGVREGLTETIVYFERMFLGRPVSHAMLTNSFSMSATSYGARRYMKLYVYWPMAVHPHLRSALLIGYGVGNTAKAMTDSSTLESIDVVDLSRDILDVNRIVYPVEADHPLNDPRVRVHIEDGRYLLQTTDREFDLITGEPPPPGLAGVEHLYSREYFDLIRRRLAEGGMVTYWLPISDLTDASARAVIAAFCDVFTDCSLWNGSGTHLMLAGTRNAAPVSDAIFSRQWMDPRVSAEMAGLGLERPEQLGALFIGDADYLRALAGAAPPLTDDHPKRLEAPLTPRSENDTFLRRLADTSGAQERFVKSPFVGRVWPGTLRTASLPYFDAQSVINAHMYGGSANAIADVHTILTATPLSAPALWRLGSNPDIQAAIDRTPADARTHPLMQFHLGLRQLSERRYAEAADTLERAALLANDAEPPMASVSNDAFALQIYALCMSGQQAIAQERIRAPWLQSLVDRGIDPDTERNAPLPPYWTWMKDTFGIDPRRR